MHKRIIQITDHKYKKLFSTLITMIKIFILIKENSFPYIIKILLV